jgi:hypothetical protein
MERPRLHVSSVVLGAADPRELAAFYHRLLGWAVAEEYPARPGHPAEDGWAILGRRRESPGCAGWPSSGNRITGRQRGPRLPVSRR